MPNSRNTRFATFRSYILLLGGLVVIGWEVIVEQSDRPAIIVASLLMMGISVPLNLEDRTARWVSMWRSYPPPPAPQKDDAEAPK